MRNLVIRIVLILAFLAFCVWYIVPPSQRLRLGKDLRGGVSLVYTVKTPEGADRGATIAQVVEVLKDRVNPRGVLDITIAPQGGDRIEVVMPLPTPEVRALQVQYRRALDGLLDGARISEADLEEALRQRTAPTRFSDEGTVRDAAVRLQETFDAARDLRTRLQTLVTESADEAAIAALEAEIAATEIAEERLRDDLLALGMDQGRFVRALSLSNEPTGLLGPDGRPVLDEAGRPVMGDSPRERELVAIKTQFPHLSRRIEEVVAAWDAYSARRRTLDDPDDLRRLLRGAGVLEFRIAVRPDRAEGVNPEQLRRQLEEGGPQAVDSAVAGWFRINDRKQWADSPVLLEALATDPVGYFAGRGLVAGVHEGEIYLLLYTTQSKSMAHSPDRPWSMQRVGRTIDSLGRPAVAFGLDSAGASLMGRLTGTNIGQPMAIVLDGEVYSAPNINSAIRGSGIIEGQFSDAELSYLIRVLAAGSLSARLSPDPISISILGPSIGGDNLRRGLRACVFSVIAVGLCMVIYYLVAGVIANIALLCMGVILFGVMSMIEGTFTLPGLAGIALTIGMAVDSNVLIYERVREEMLNNGEDLRSALRIAFKRVFNTIVDGQFTNLIVCVVLVWVATAEVKGFAVTMIIGVFATLFTAMVITPTIFRVYTDVLGCRTLPMLPTVFPALHRFLEPKIDWMSMRKAFYAFSIIVCGLGLVLVFSRGKELLDTEFRGGVALTMTTREARPGEAADPENRRLLLSRAEVERRVREAGAASDDPVIAELRAASVLTVGDTTPDFRSTTFQVKVANPAAVGAEEDVADRVQDAVVRLFAAELDVVPELRFRGMEERESAAFTFPLERSRLGDVIGRPGFGDPVGNAFMGGVAIVLDDIEPPITVEAADQRIRRMRQQPDFSYALGRDQRVVGLELADPDDPSKGFSSIAVLVADRDIDARRVDLAVWDQRLARPEWLLVSQAMRQASTLDQVSSFSSAVARTLSAQAVVAVALSVLGILAYVWFRFASLRYSVASLTATAHDVIIALTAITATHYIANTPLGRLLLIEEFRIDLNVVAGMLTLIGYSLNDTIVIMDRIRENRGKLPLATARTINLSLNQTMSRTVLTSGTTMIALLILYIEGGTGIRPFAFVLLIGLITGTYSSIAIAAPLVWSGEVSRGPGRGESLGGSSGRRDEREALPGS
ncbi:MAG TPA: protein translocase subunit SecD [Phycisphaerales bacterium]|nr:protein translocase subunit SecD [Phycisphaerales bacterium]HMP37450.1 protein translocase subunit SecD [Phycisphaerales bacterium]